MHSHLIKFEQNLLGEFLPELFLEQPVRRAGILVEDTEHTQGPVNEKNPVN